MIHFSVHFFRSNLLLAGFLCIILLMKRWFRRWLLGRMRYNFSLIILAFLLIPFLPSSVVQIPRFFSRMMRAGDFALSPAEDAGYMTMDTARNAASNWINDFSISVDRTVCIRAACLFLIAWLTGMILMLFFLIKSRSRLHRIERSALPLQSAAVQAVYDTCILEIGLKKKIPVYSTAFLKSPAMTGIFRPRIYLPIHLISDFNEKELRYMLLHELQHYKHHDPWINCAANAAAVLYWFNLPVRYVLREMRDEREIACDSSVLELLDKKEYEDYGHTLIHFAEKISFFSFPYASGMGGNNSQIKKRIINIAAYQSQSLWEKLRGISVLCILTLLMLVISPTLCITASGTEHYTFSEEETKISYIDLSSDFGTYNGSFVLFDTAAENWLIYNKEAAETRISPDSTYKIYDALIGLESGIILPDQSRITWNGETYPFETWNQDQDLISAMQNSVNWYFQEIDRRAGTSLIADYLGAIGYGNQDISGGTASYWLESSLKISPIEQVELLKKLHDNEFRFRPDTIKTVRDALCLSSADGNSMYGKTGTGRVNGKDINGWFVGYIETDGNVYYFAANIQGTANATGSKAAEITAAVLSDRGIWNDLK